MAESPLTPEQEELLAEMLEAFSEASGIPLEEIMASEFEEPEPEFISTDIGEEELEAAEEIFDLENEFSGDSGDYLDDLMDDLDIDPGDEDAYAEDGV